VVFPAPIMSTIAELGAFLAQETSAANQTALPTAASKPTHPATVNGAATPN